MSDLEQHQTFSTVVTSEGGHLVLTLHGDVSDDAVAALTDHLDAALGGSDGRVIVDVTHARIVTLAGLYALVQAHRQALTRKATLALRAPSPALLQMIDTSGHGDELTIVADDRPAQVFCIEGFVDGEPAVLHWTDSLGGTDAALTRVRLLADLGVRVGTGADLGEITATLDAPFPGGVLTAMAAFDAVTEAWFDLPTGPAA